MPVNIHIVQGVLKSDFTKNIKVSGNYLFAFRVNVIMIVAYYFQTTLYKSKLHPHFGCWDRKLTKKVVSFLSQIGNLQKRLSVVTQLIA